MVSNLQFYSCVANDETVSKKGICIHHYLKSVNTLYIIVQDGQTLKSIKEKKVR